MLSRKTCVFKVISECKITDTPEKLLLITYKNFLENICISTKKPLLPQIAIVLLDQKQHGI